MNEHNKSVLKRAIVNLIILVIDIILIVAVPYLRENQAIIWRTTTFILVIVNICMGNGNQKNQ